MASTRDQDPTCFLDAVEAIELALKENGLYDNVEKSFINWVAEFILWHYNSVNTESKIKIYERINRQLLPELLCFDRDFFFSEKTWTKLRNIKTA